MKQSLLTLLFFSVGLPALQAQFTDNFNDGDFANAPAWGGNTAEFTVNASLQLQLNNTVAATSYLSSAFAAATLDNTQWEFYISETFAPSSSNFGKVYLAADQSDLTQPLNGYYLQFGEAGSTDAVRLFAQTGGTSTPVCNGTIGAIAASFGIRVKVLRDNAANWQIWVDYSGGNNYVLEASGNNGTHNSSSFLGVTCIYTVSNATKFFFDDFYMGPVIVDNTPPDAVSGTPVTSTQLDVLFNEPMDSASVNNELNYTCNNGIGTPSQAVRDASNFSLVHLTFSTPFTNLTNYSVIINNVQDVSLNNLAADTVNFLFALPGTAGWRDVVINELMPDPNPPIGLPDAEYVELYNAGPNVYNLNGWKLSDGSSTATLGSFLLYPGDYVILCSATNAPLFSGFGSVLSCSLPTLNNDTDILTLTDGTNVIDRVIYSDTWYQDASKKSGGWSLEQVNPALACTNGFNWRASNHFNGGTPGFANSIYDTLGDYTAPQLVSTEALSSLQVQLNFNETLDSNAVLAASYVLTGGPAVTGVQNISPAYSSVLIDFTVPLDSGIVYPLTISGLSDCSGNTATLNGTVILPYQAMPGDVIINEVLSDPKTGGHDYVEVVNISDRILSLKDWTLANYANDTIANHKTISVSHVILQPGEYLVMTTDKNDLIHDYPLAAADRIWVMAALPSYNNDSGTVYLINNLNIISDKFSYNSDMHFALLESTDGVALERLRFDAPTQDPNNWHSAAEAVGFGTPGYLNSQYQDGEADGTVGVTPEIFSPDSDGYNDILTIEYDFGEAGRVANVMIYDTHGRLVKELARNSLLGSTGRIIWDGANEKREKSPAGIYIIYFETFNLQGKVSKYKLSCVLATKFD